MLVDVEDQARTGLADSVVSAWGNVQDLLGEQGIRLARPVHAKIVDMPIMGASNFDGVAHTLYVSKQAARSEMLEGLVGHEASHMVLMERGHPSHDFRRLIRIAQDVSGRSKPLGSVLVEVQKHAQDIDADDIAIAVIVRDLAVPFFTNWVAGNLERAGTDRERNTLLWATNCFAVANLERHDLVRGGEAVYELVEDFDRRAGTTRSEALVSRYRDLPPTDAALDVDRALRGLCETAAAQYRDLGH